MDISADLTRIALAEDGELKELYYESKREESLVGNVYAGRVANVMPNLQAAFVDIGAEKNGYYYYGNARAVSDAEKKQRKTEGRGYTAIAGGEGCGRHEGCGADGAFFLSGEISGAPA